MPYLDISGCKVLQANLSKSDLGLVKIETC